MRWLLLKDLQILRRSPLQAALLIVYPVLIAILVGLAVSRGPSEPRVALLNEVPQNARVSLSGKKLPSANVQRRIERSQPESSSPVISAAMAKANGTEKLM